MELLLNLIWLALSVALGVLLVASRSRCEAEAKDCSHSRSTAWVAYVILIALLLPAISMTDDLMAMATPCDGEQIARRYDSPCLGQQHQHSAIVVAVFHAARSSSDTSLVCVGRQEAPADFPLIFFPSLRNARGRAPPTSA